MKGKAKCKALKEIRKKIAEENSIEYIVSECTHQGDCKGTCPKCEAEVRYLEKELALRESIGKAVAVAGVAASVCLGLTACGKDSKPETSKNTDPGSKNTKEEEEKNSSNLWSSLFGNDDNELAGDIDIEGEEYDNPNTGGDSDDIDGGLVEPDDEGDDACGNGGEEEPVELEGDVAYFPESEEE